jgi:uncharacterized protein YjbI with pentapeptide repeats
MNAIAWVKQFSTLTVGAIAGGTVVFVVVVYNASLNEVLIPAAMFGIVAAAFFAFAMQRLRIAARAPLDQVLRSDVVEQFRHAIERATGIALPAEKAKAIADAVVNYGSMWLYSASTFAMLSLAVTLAATLLVLGQTQAAFQQVARLDTQNTLALRNAFWTQIDSLTNAMEDVKDQTENDEYGESRENKLRTRIAMALQATQDHREVKGIDDGVSPERGQLLSLLLSEGFAPFLQRHSFAHADLSGQMVFHASTSRLSNYATGNLNLQFTNWIGAQIGAIDFSDANFSNSVLPEATAFQEDFVDGPAQRSVGYARFVSTEPSFVPRKRYAAGSSYNRPRRASETELQGMMGADFTNAVVPVEGWLEDMRQRVGGTRIEFSLWEVNNEEGFWRLRLDPVSVTLNKLMRSTDLTTVCTSSNGESGARKVDVIATINAQATHSYSRFSKEKGWLIISTPNDQLRCLQAAGANLRNAFAGADLMEQDVDVRGLDLSQASFEGGALGSVDARGARLPSAAAFRGFRLSPFAAALQIEDAIVPSKRWLQELAGEVLLHDGRHTVGSLPSDCWGPPDRAGRPGLCVLLEGYELVAQSGQEWRVVKKQ